MSPLISAFFAYFSNNKRLSLSFCISIATHIILLMLHFVAPKPIKLPPINTNLEIILVNAKHESPPLEAQALAQVSLDGGGNAEEGRAKSPVPNAGEVTPGNQLIDARKNIAAMEAQQKQLLMQTKRPATVATLPVDNTKNRPQKRQRNSAEILEEAQALRLKEAEIAKNIAQYNKRPKKTQITPSTREVGYAMYYKTLQERLERTGTLNFPQLNGRHLYGKLIVTIPVFQDGTIYQGDGGVRIERSSGNSALDTAALNIIRRAAPFGRFPQSMRSSDKEDVWEITTTLHFTHGALRSVLTSD